MNAVEKKFTEAEDRGKSLDGTISENVLAISQLTHEKQEITNKYYETEKKLTDTQTLIEDAE